MRTSEEHLLLGVLKTKLEKADDSDILLKCDYNGRRMLSLEPPSRMSRGRRKRRCVEGGGCSERRHEGS